VELLDKCAGTVVIALERSFFPTGLDKPGGPNEIQLTDVRLPTPWNRIEAAMAYSRGHPLLVIVENGLKNEGLLERGYDWFVQFVEPVPSALTTLEFNGVLASWKQKLVSRKARGTSVATSNSSKSPADLTIGELVSGLRPAQLWGILAALATALAGAFALGAKFFRL
jgi:hypothetical protein